MGRLIDWVRGLIARRPVVIELGPDDTLVVQVDQGLNHRQLQRLNAKLMEAIRDKQRVIVCDFAIDTLVIRHLPAGKGEGEVESL